MISRSLNRYIINKSCWFQSTGQILAVDAVGVKFAIVARVESYAVEWAGANTGEQNRASRRILIFFIDLY